jgi:hypothetical protein
MRAPAIRHQVPQGPIVVPRNKDRATANILGVSVAHSSSAPASSFGLAIARELVTLRCLRRNGYLVASILVKAGSHQLLVFPVKAVATPSESHSCCSAAQQQHDLPQTGRNQSRQDPVTCSSRKKARMSAAGSLGFEEGHRRNSAFASCTPVLVAR